MEAGLGSEYTQDNLGVGHTHRTPRRNRGGLNLLSFSLTVENGTISMLTAADKVSCTCTHSFVIFSIVWNKAD